MRIQSKMMGHYIGEILICILLISSISGIYGVTQVIKYILAGSGNINDLLSSSHEYSWIIRLCSNSLGYASILLPGYLIYKYVRWTQYLQKNGNGIVHDLIHSCLIGSKGGLLDSPGNNSQAGSPVSRTFLQDAIVLCHCFIGLQGSYLTWGYFQEKIMTQEYVDLDGTKAHFKDSQFLVFVNRILAFLISGLYLLFKPQGHHTTPLYKYVFCSLSNILSSWCQYEALKYISFPTQVLAKASKIIPVMIMGKIVSRAKYEYYEYLTAILISIGMTFFMFGSAEDDTRTTTTASGIILLGGYMVLDSFTSNWQNAIFTEYSVTSVQMMCAVNMFSCLLTAMSLFQQSSFFDSLTFMTKYPSFITDCLFISICSASGQLYIFYTISKFGAVTFVIIMTIRQALAIFLSTWIYQHNITLLGTIGIILIFGSVFLRIYCNHRLRSIKQRKKQLSTIKV